MEPESSLQLSQHPPSPHFIILATSSQVTHFQQLFLRCILSSSPISVCFQNITSPSDFHTKNLYAPSPYPKIVTCPIRQNVLYLINQIANICSGLPIMKLLIIQSSHSLFHKYTRICLPLISSLIQFQFLELLLNI